MSPNTVSGVASGKRPAVATMESRHFNRGERFRARGNPLLALRRDDLGGAVSRVPKLARSAG